MKRNLMIALMVGFVVLVSCQPSRTTQTSKPLENSMSKDIEGTKVATIGGGCFWCTEAVYERIDGIVDVYSGYAGGDKENPTYQEVTTGRTGHAEVVQLVYDPKKISYEKILELFWKSHDPTTPNRQGADVGTQYRSIILYHDDEQKAIAEKAIALENASGHYGNPIVTTVEPLKQFYVAEDYHQDYYETNPYAGYCSFVIRPKLDKLGLELEPVK